MLSGCRLQIIYTALRTEKSRHYNSGNFIIPKEEDLVSMCLDEDRLWILANSPVINPVDGKYSLYVLYEGSMNNMSHLLARKELLMN